MVGVMVMVAVPVWPAVIVRVAEPVETLKSGMVTVTKVPPVAAA